MSRTDSGFVTPGAPARGTRPGSFFISLFFHYPFAEVTPPLETGESLSLAETKTLFVKLQIFCSSAAGRLSPP